jgi:prophage maintenance system killer protein
MKNEKQISSYKLNDKENALEVLVSSETVWLTLNQLSELFNRDKSVISRHIGNVFREEELNKTSTVAKFATVQHEGNRSIERTLEYYNLDIIISVGYRVKSKEGTTFRIWATSVLKNHFQRQVNQLKKYENKYIELVKTLNIATSTVQNNSLKTDETKGILNVLNEYAYALETLDHYDHQKLEINPTFPDTIYELKYDEAIYEINRWRESQNSGMLFGNEKDQSFKSSLATISQTFDGKDLYRSIEEKAATLLYLIVKNHSFSDGNKRIGAGIFVYYLEKNNILYRKDSSKRIADNALVAITLMIAESKPEEKDTMIKLVVNLINDKN